MGLAYNGVDLTNECRCIQIFFCTVLIELLIGRIVDAKVEVQHARYAIHADTVCVEAFDPEQCVGTQEADNLRSTEIEFMGSPVGMNLALVEHLAIECGQTLGIRAESSRNPVENDTDSSFMAAFYKMHELLGGAILRGRGEVAGGLIAP